MPDRLIRESALTSETLAKLSHFAERLFWRLTVVVDDYGRFSATPAIISGRCLPLVNSTAKQVVEALEEMSAAGTIELYTVASKRYLQFTNWSTHQRTHQGKPKWPSPETCGNLPPLAATPDRVTSDPLSITNTISSLKEGKEESEKEGEITAKDLMDGWNDLCAPLGLARVALLSDTRKRKAAARAHEHREVVFWNRVFGRIKTSAFLLGRTNNSNGHQKWRIDFDWLIDNDTNCVKVYEGKYNAEIH